MLPLINTVVFPRMTVPLLVDNPASVLALRVAEERGPLILLVAQRDEGLKRVTPADLHPVGTVAQVVQSIRVPNGGMQVVVQGLNRARVLACEEQTADERPAERQAQPEAAADAEAAGAEAAGAEARGGRRRRRSRPPGGG